MENANKEYDFLLDAEIDPFTFLDFKSLAEYEFFIASTSWLDNAILTLGSLIEKNQKKSRDPEKFLTLFCVARAFNSLKMLRNLCKGMPTHDFIGLSRPIYESLLRIRFMFSDPEMVETFLMQLLVRSGSVKYKVDASGKLNPNWIVDELGREYRTRFNSKRMAQATKEQSDITLYEEIYPFLSAVAHADFSDFALYFSPKDGFFHNAHARNVIEPVLVSVLLSILLLDELSQYPKLNTLSRRDAAYFCKTTARKMLKLEKKHKVEFLLGLPECRRRVELMTRVKRMQ